MKQDIYLLLLNSDNNKSFKKYFDTEFERDKFAGRLRYSKKLTVLERGGDFGYTS